MELSVVKDAKASSKDLSVNNWVTNVEVLKCVKLQKITEIVANIAVYKNACQWE